MKLRVEKAFGASLIAGAVLFAGCGGNDDGVASELAKQRAVAEAKRQGAKDATQSAKIRQLQRKLKRRGNENRTVVVTEESPTTGYQSKPSTASAADDWPGGSAYTAILASLGSESEALSFQSEARAAGLDAGVLHSSDYGSLNPGYWVVFSGTYDSSDGAASRASRAKSLGYSSAYPRFVSP